jgi:ATP-binding cassette subfamily C protein LapB
MTESSVSKAPEGSNTPGSDLLELGPSPSQTSKPHAGASRPPSYLEDPQLARQLSRLAAIHGRSVPAFRFGMVTQTDAGVPLENLARHERAMELWQAHFPQGEVRQVLISEVKRTEFPLLWFSQDDSQVLVIRGPLTQGGFNAEDDQGEPLDATAAQLSTGYLLQLRTDDESWTQDEDKPKSAAEWFDYAVRRHRKIFVEAIVATFVLSTIGMASALYTMQVYDRVVPTKGFATLWVLTVGVAIAIAIELLMKQVRAAMVDRACKAIDLELSAVFFAKALDIRMDARPDTVGTFTAQIQHFQSVRNFMTSSTLFILADAPFALFFILVIAMIAGPVALVPLTVVPVAIFAGLAFRKPIEKATAAHVQESNAKNGLLIEAIDGIESVKAAGGEWKAIDRWRKLTARIAESELSIKSNSVLSTNLTMTIQQVSYVGIVAVGAYAISTGSLTMGGLIACSIISGRALTPLAQMPNLIVQWKQAQISLKALDAIMAMPSERDPDIRLVVPESCSGHMRLEKVNFQYRKDVVTLDIPNLSIGPGERVAIVGPVGSGKSTLIKILSGLYRPTSGTVFLDGIEVSHLAPEFVRENIGYLPQDVRLFNGTLRDNLVLGLPAPSDSQILKAASLTGLAQAIADHPRGLELQIAEGGRGLSGGQRQLVGLTRMLLAQPKIMLLDEPTASMDARLEARVMQHLFQEIAPESILVVVTHKVAVLPHVSRVIVIHKGQISVDGPRDEVLARMKSSTAQTDSVAA